jgi:outer membrane protein/protease secretion system outer membrane protein
LLAFAAGCFASETPLTAYRAAVQNNATYLAARASVEAEREAPNIAFGQLLPNLSIAGSNSRNDVDRSQGAVTSNFRYTGYAYSLNLRQPLYRPFSFAAYEQSNAQAGAAEATFSQSRGDLSLKVLTAFLDVNFADDVARLLQTQKAAIEAQAAAAEKGIAAGSGTRIDLDEARSRLDFVRAQEIETQYLQDNARRALQALIARPATALAALRPERIDLAMPRPGSLEAWIVEAEAANPELLAARQRTVMAEHEVDKASAGHHPTLDLVVSSGRTGNDSLATLSSAGDTRFKQNTVGLQLSVPILAGGQVNAAVRQARARLEQAGHQAEEIRRNLGLQLGREYGNLSQGAAKIRALERAEVSALQTYESSRKGVLAGVRSTLDVLLADQQLFTVRRDLARERYQFLISRLRLATLAGREAEADLVLMSAWFSAP